MNTHALGQDFLQHAATKLAEDGVQIERCAALLDPAELWHRANDRCNSVGNLILHLTGNVRQWILSGLAGQPLERNRPAEFAERGPRAAAEIMAGLRQTVDGAVEVLRRLGTPALEARYCIQGYEVSGLVAVFHVVEHFATHTGQIVQMTKALKNLDLSRYDADGRKLIGSPGIP